MNKEINYDEMCQKASDYLSDPNQQKNISIWQFIEVIGFITNTLPAKVCIDILKTQKNYE